MSVAPRAASSIAFDEYGPYAPKPGRGLDRTGVPQPDHGRRLERLPGRAGPLSLVRGEAVSVLPSGHDHSALKGLEHVVSVLVLDPMRDGRGWAFREGDGHGLDDVNGFALLSEAYRATEPGFAGHYSAPVLWDRAGNPMAMDNVRRPAVDCVDRDWQAWLLYFAAVLRCCTAS